MSNAICRAIVVVLAFFAWHATAAAAADPLLGAGKAIERLNPQQPAPGGKTEKADPVAAFIDDLDRYAGTGTGAADGWIALFIRWQKLRTQVDSSNAAHFDRKLRSRVSTLSLIVRLPPAAAWPELERRLRKDRTLNTAGLDLLGTALAGGDMTKAIERARARIAQLPTEQRPAMERTLQSIHAMTSAEETKSVIGAFEHDLEERAKLGNTKSKLQIPDLVTLVGRERATQLLARALLLPSTSLTVPVGDETRELAQKLLLEKPSQLRVPQWGLVRAPNAKAVYEAITAQFPEAASSTQSAEDLFASEDFDFEADIDYGGMYQEASERTEAQLHYLVGLIVANEAAKAEQLAMQLLKGGELRNAGMALRELRRQGFSAQLYGFFKVLLERNPALTGWETFFELAAENGKTDEALAVVERALRNKGLSPAARRELMAQRVNALLAADKTGDALVEAERLITAPENQEDSLSPFRADLALKMMNAGRLAGDQKRFRKGVEHAAQQLGKPWTEDARYEKSRLTAAFLKALRQAGLLAEAERTVLAQVQELQSGSNAEMMSAFAITDPRTRSLLVELAGIYYQAGRWDDVLRFVQGVSLWGADDLAALAYESDSHKVPLGHMVARALLEKGDKAHAKPILEAVLMADGGFDPAYESYVGAFPEGASAFLDELYSRDRFQERPLIWKAVLLVQGGKATEAEAVARKAIAIDPSDGEQGAGHRMRAYAILADALQQRGQLETAEAYRGAIRAIRMSESADELRLAGLHARAIALYTKALDEFSGAYCIQSRLAVELSRAGRHQEAEQHYRRAYELMPDSFGRVESHCFGCEKVFESEKAQGVAESVFQALLKKTPDKPQVHYLMGYLRAEQGRYLEALEFFRAAVAIDPEYLNAWTKLYEAGNHVHLDRGERDLIVMKILALDPQVRHSRPDFQDVTDLKALWRGVAAAQQQARPLAKQLLPLTASASQRAEARAKLPEPMRLSMDLSMEMSLDVERMEQRRLPEPGMALMQTKLVRTIVEVIDKGR